MPDNFFEDHGGAKRAMRESLFPEVYLVASTLPVIHVKGWISSSNLYERHGKRWHLYLPRVEILRRLAMRNQRKLAAPPEIRPG
jgi:hypothetical protein